MPFRNSPITARLGASALGPKSSARDSCVAHTRDGGGNRVDRDWSVVTRRSLDLCRPAAISGAIEAISRLTQQPAARYRSLTQQSLAEHRWPKDRELGELGGEWSLMFVAPGSLSTTNGPEPVRSRCPNVRGTMTAPAGRNRAAKGEQLRAAGRRRQSGNGRESARNRRRSRTCGAADQPRQRPFPRPSRCSRGRAVPPRFPAGHEFPNGIAVKP